MPSALSCPQLSDGTNSRAPPKQRRALNCFPLSESNLSSSSLSHYECTHPKSGRFPRRELRPLLLVLSLTMVTSSPLKTSRRLLFVILLRFSLSTRVVVVVVVRRCGLAAMGCKSVAASFRNHNSINRGQQCQNDALYHVEEGTTVTTNKQFGAVHQPLNVAEAS